MSFCYDCSDRGYDMCFCKPIKQPNINFVSEIDTIKKLQEQNKTLREALEFYSKTNHWLGLTDKVPFDITKWIRIVEDDMDQNNIGGKRVKW